MAPMTSKTLITLLLLLGSSAWAAPLKVRQLAGEGAAADSVLSGTDNAVGYGLEDALDNTAQLISGQKPAPPAGGSSKRQLAGEGAAANSVLSGTDNAIGYGLEDALDNTAQLISGQKPAAPAGGSSKHRRQLDKISNGVEAVAEAANIGGSTSAITTAGDNIDGELTSGAANVGAEVGSTEESVVESAGAAIPKQRRQLDKISNGVQAVGNAAGLGTVTEPVTTLGDNVDGQLTEDAATVGQQVGDDEVTVAEQAGGDVPTQL